MASTTFVDNSSIIYASWLNDVNGAVYNGTFISSTITPTNIVCNGSVSGTGFSGLVNNTLTAPGAIGNGTPNTGAFTTLSSNAVAITGGSISGANITGTRIVGISPNGGSSGAITLADAVGNPNAVYLQAVNNARNVEYSSIYFNSNGTISVNAPLAATSFSGAGTGLTGTANSLNAGLGVGQTWTTYNSTTRPTNTTRTNSSTKPIMVCFSFTAQNYNLITFYVNSVAVFSAGQNVYTNTDGGSICGIVPAGATYSMNGTYQSWISWAELS